MRAEPINRDAEFADEEFITTHVMIFFSFELNSELSIKYSRQKYSPFSPSFNYMIPFLIMILFSGSVLFCPRHGNDFPDLKREEVAAVSWPQYEGYVCTPPCTSYGYDFGVV